MDKFPGRHGNQGYSPLKDHFLPFPVLNKKEGLPRPWNSRGQNTHKRAPSAFPEIRRHGSGRAEREGRKENEKEARAEEVKQGGNRGPALPLPPKQRRFLLHYHPATSCESIGCTFELPPIAAWCTGYAHTLATRSR